MKSLVGRILSVGMALAAAVSLNAQDKTVTAYVPFNFYVGTTAMPAGDYRVSQLMSGTVLYLKETDSQATTSITTVSVAGKMENEPARLVFHRYGETYFLAQVWTGDKPYGQGISKSKREKVIAQDRAPGSLAVIQLALR